MNCPYCNNPVPAGAVNCPSCGAQLPQQYQQQQYQQPQYQQYQQQQYQQYQQYQQPQYQQYQQYQGYYNQEPEKVNMFTALKKYAQFEGRSRRSEFWLFTLGRFLISIGLGIIGTFLSIMIDDYSLILGDVLQSLWSLAVFIPELAVAIRRLHDTGRSGWNLLWALLPCIGWIILIIYYCQDSEPGPNQYGYNPKGIGNNQY